VSYKEVRLEVAAQILAGFAANPAIFAQNDRCGWTLVNVSDADISGYAVRLAGQLIDANDSIPQFGLPQEEKP